MQAVWIADEGEKFAGDWVFMPINGGYNLPERDLQIIEAMATTTTYRALRRITLEFPSQNKRLKIKAGQILTGEVADNFLYFITEFGPARIPLVLLEPAK